MTSPRVFQQATPTADAVAFVDAVLACPGVLLATLGPEWPRLREICLGQGREGNDLPDAWLAAAVDRLGEHLAGFDCGFSGCSGERNSRCCRSPYTS